jgi:hypothetical protein
LLASLACRNYYEPPQQSAAALARSPRSMTNDTHVDAWRGRFEAIARAQSHYLWFVLVVTAFYLALQYAPDQSVTVPILDLALNSNVVLAVGGPALSLLLVALVGSLLEWGHTAERAFGPSWRDVIERYDLHPTVFDLAHYTVRERSRVLDIVAYFLFYPTFLMVALAEGASLLVWLARHQAPGRVLFLVLGVSLWLWAAWLVLSEIWWQRLKKVPEKWRARSARTG